MKHYLVFTNNRFYKRTFDKKLPSIMNKIRFKYWNKYLVINNISNQVGNCNKNPKIQNNLNCQLQIITISIIGLYKLFV